MTCELCAGKGLIRIGYHEPPDGHGDIAICLCRKGRQVRSQIDRGVTAMLADRYRVPVENVGLVEEMLDAEDIPASMRPRQTVPVVDVSEAGRRVARPRL